MLNGKGPFRFRVDTGANGSVVAAEVIAALGAPILGERLVYGTTGVATLAFANVGRLTAGTVTRRNLPVSIAPPGAVMRSDGILGADIFAGQRLVFDMRARQVELLNSNAIRFRDPRPRNMHLRNGMLAEVAGTVGGIPVRLMLDTGADVCIVNPALYALLRRSGLDARRFGPGTIIGVTGHQVTGDFVALPAVKFAGLTLGDALAVAADVPIFGVWGLDSDPAMIVGVDVFSKLSRCVFDYSRKRFDAFVLGPGAGSGVQIARTGLGGPA